MLHYPRRFAQRGFTLVEMAIVLVIIGILLAGVLKGQELIENSRVKDAANIINGTIAAYNSYIDRYGRLPGDDGPTAAALTGRGGTWWSVTAAGNNDGDIDIVAADTFADAGEQVPFWQHLRAAGYIKGAPTANGLNALPRHSWGGLVGMTNAAVQGRAVARLLVCMRDVPGKAALALDRQLDDGIPSTGTLRATLGVNANPGGAAGAYNEGQVYTICQDV